MTDLSISEVSYSKLLKQLKNEIAEGLVRAQGAYDKKKNNGVRSGLNQT